ncbi:MAG: RNA-binding protein [candidate division Zixibacteria bacterium]|nr:RNA-binding protein [candidate division Zixibacteria bacterium]
MKLYVGNLSPSTTEDTLRQKFESFGEVSSVNIIKDRYSGESRGFGFVEMMTKSEAESAMTDLNGSELDGKSLNVNEARARNDNRGGGGGRGGGGNRGGGGGGRRSW